MDNSQPPLVQGPEPNILVKLMRAWRAARASRPARAPGPKTQISHDEAARRYAAQPKPVKKPRPPSPMGPRQPSVAPPGSGRIERGLAPWLMIPPTVFVAAPVAAAYLGDARAVIDALVLGGGWLNIVRLCLHALTWQPVALAVITGVMRLIAISKAGTNAWTGSQWFFGATLIDCVAWFVIGRHRLTDPAELQAGHDFAVCFALYGMALWGVFGPPVRKRFGDRDVFQRDRDWRDDD